MVYFCLLASERRGGSQGTGWSWGHRPQSCICCFVALNPGLLLWGLGFPGCEEWGWGSVVSEEVLL